MEKIIKGLSSQQGRKMVGPKSIKKLCKPKTHEGIGLRAYETKGRKEKAQPAKIRKLKGCLMIKTGLGYPKAAKSSGSSRRAAKLG